MFEEDEEATAPRGPWYYAQLDGGGTCVAITEAAGPVDDPSMVPIETLDPSLMGKMRIGDEWVAPERAADPTQWLIDVGPFFDRFGAAKMAVLTSSSPVAKALITDCSVRRWIDLRRPDLPAAMDMLIATGIPGVDAALKAAILDTPVSAEENMALRVAFFGGVA